MEFSKTLVQKGAMFLSILVVAVIGLALWALNLQTPPQPGPLLEKAWAKTLEAQSYSFASTTTILVDGKQRVLSKLTGEIRQGEFHIAGEMVNTQVEMYQIGNNIYLKDIFYKDRWKVLEKMTLKARPLLDAEINPLAYLKLKDMGQTTLSGEEELNGRAVYRIRTVPAVENQFLNMLYSDFETTFLIGKWDKKIWHASLVAHSKEKPADTIRIEISLNNFGDIKPFKPPVQVQPLESGQPK